MVEKEKKKVEETKKEDFEKLRSPTHAKIYSTNSFVGCSNQDIRIDLCNEKFRDEKHKKWGFVVDATIILSPVGAKRLFESLSKTLKGYEKEHGTIDIDFDEGIIKFV